MTSFSVFALNSKQELFLGYTESLSNDPRELLVEMLPKLSPARSRYWAEIQQTPPVHIERRRIPNNDPIADSLEQGQYLQDGKPYLADR